MRDCEGKRKEAQLKCCGEKVDRQQEGFSSGSNAIGRFLKKNCNKSRVFQRNHSHKMALLANFL